MDPILGAGVKFGYKNADGTGNLTNIARVLDIQPGAVTIAKTDVSNHDSPNKKKEYIEGWEEVGDTTVDIIFSAADVATVRGLLTGRTRKTWVITFADGSTETYSPAFLTSQSIVAPLDKEMTQKVAICLAVGGTIVFGPAGS